MKDFKRGDIVTIVGEEAEVVSVEVDNAQTKNDQTKIKMLTGSSVGKEFWVRADTLELKS